MKPAIRDEDAPSEHRPLTLSLRPTVGLAPYRLFEIPPNPNLGEIR